MLLLLEHDAKELLADAGCPVPAGALMDCVPPLDGGPRGPWMVKAQVATGGRGKAGGIRLARDEAELRAAYAAISGMRIGPHRVEEVRIESAVTDAREAYFSISLDARTGRLSVMASPEGGVEIEEHAGSMVIEQAAPEPSALHDAVHAVVSALPADIRPAMAQAGHLLADFFLDRDACLVEINPLFLMPDGSWIAGDARVAIDENALPRQPELGALIDRRAEAYRDAVFKRRHGFDLVIVDRQGTIGLVTTGAGLSMQLIDEMTELGARPYNFCDIRSGMMRGDPARLVEALTCVAQGEATRCVLVNIFAGITDLAEFAQSLVDALAALPAFDLPLVVRLAGNNETRAEEVLRRSGLAFDIERDLERAVGRCVEIARGGVHAVAAH
jgi:succinyl-CoA synthetase beta subunit